MVLNLRDPVQLVLIVGHVAHERDHGGEDGYRLHLVEEEVSVLHLHLDPAMVLRHHVLLMLHRFDQLLTLRYLFKERFLP